jgi:purine nucleosidase
MMKLVIDTDTAGDDVTSLLFGLRWPGVELEAITVVAGNVYLDQCVQNALYTCEVADRPDVPVYAGADRPLLRELVTRSQRAWGRWHGQLRLPKSDEGC